MPTKLKAVRLLGLTVGVCLILSTLLGFGYSQKAPIAKEGLLRSLGRKVLSSKTLVRQVEQRGVNFKLSAADEQEIRRVGKYLGKKGLDELVTAVRNSYRGAASAQPARSNPSSLNQTMINSPGGVQAGGDIIINQKPEPRNLTQSQLDRIGKLLRPHSGQKLFLIRLGEQEANRFATQIERVFRGAGWEVDIHDVGHESPPMYGLRLGVPDPNRLPPHAMAIYSSFENTSTPVAVTDTSHILPLPPTELGLGENEIGLHVGLRPLD